MKSENLSIGFAIVLEQVVKISNDEAAANKRLYEIGKQMGIRMCDEFNSRECSYLSPAETIKALITKIIKDSFGITFTLTQQSIRYEKRFHFYDLTYSQSGINKSILSLCEDIDDKFSILQPCNLIAGFIYGVLQNMDFYGEVTATKVENQRDKLKYVISVKKNIKQQD